jgi:hypothetical protein
MRLRSIWMLPGCTAAARTSRVQVQGAIEELVKRAKKSGDIRKDLDAMDLLRALIGVSNVSAKQDLQQSARRLVAILIAGLRPGN